MRIVLGAMLPIALAWCVRQFSEAVWLAGLKDRNHDVYVKRAEWFGAALAVASALLVVVVVRMITDWNEEKPPQTEPLFPSDESTSGYDKHV